MRILVTGGAGFIGSHITDALLAAGHDVAVIDDLCSGSLENVPSKAKFYQVDIRDTQAVQRAFEEFRPDAVSHHAAQMSVSRSVVEPHFDAEVNLLGLINIASAAVAVKSKRIVFASSGGVLYGEVTSPAPEETPANPISPYGISKWGGEQYLKFFSREHGLSSLALRYANVYGERQNPHGEAGVVAIFCTRLLRGESAAINGDGHYVRDYVHVSDVVTANLLALQSEAEGFDALNVGTGVPTDVNQLAEAIRTNCQQELERLGKSTIIPELKHGPARPGDLRSNLVSFQKAKQKLGWSPEIDLATGLKRTVHWFAQKLQ